MVQEVCIYKMNENFHAWRTSKFIPTEIASILYLIQLCVAIFVLFCPSRTSLKTVMQEVCIPKRGSSIMRGKRAIPFPHSN